MLRRILPAALTACTMLVACTDSTGPEASRIGVERVAPQFGVEESGIHILYRSASAPPLETYEAAVWACRDKSRSLVILYQQGDGAEDKEGRDEDEEGRDEDEEGRDEDEEGRDEDEEGRDEDDAEVEATRVFLQLDIPKGALLRRPDGRRFGKSDCVQITVTVDPMYLVAEVEPHGLQFSSKNPARLNIWYGEADPDLLVQESDLAIWRLPHDGDSWDEQPVWHFQGEKRLQTQLRQFSHYAVAH